MKRALMIAGILALLCAAAAFFALTVAALQLREDMDELSNRLDATLVAVNRPCEADGCGTLAALDQTVQRIGQTANAASASLFTLNRTLEAVNRPCGRNAPCGTLADVAKTLDTARGTLGEVELAAHHERHNLAALDAQEASLFVGAHQALGDLHGLLTAPDLLATAQHVNQSTAALADATVQADGILRDAREEADRLAHPAKKKLGFWGGIWAAAQAVHKLSPPLF